jgi:predicted MPP superfamily phosphohydrolase
VRRFGRARALSPALRIADVALDLIWHGGWAAALARRAGAQEPPRVASHTFRAGAPAATAGAPPLRIAFASDFHAGPTTHPSVIAHACAALADARPDLLLLGGDFVSFHARYVDALVPQLGAIPAPLGRFAVLGNHDLMADDAHVVRRLEEHGVHLLTNRNVRLPPPHDFVWICGLDDAEQGRPDADAAFAGAAGVRLVLMHSPAATRTAARSCCPAGARSSSRKARSRADTAARASSRSSAIRPPSAGTRRVLAPASA